MPKVKTKQIEADAHFSMMDSWTYDKFRITGLADPVNLYDAVNLQTLYSYAFSGGTLSLSGLTDVTIINPINDQILVYSGGTWVNIYNSGGTLANLGDVNLTSLSENQFLVYSGGTWINTSNVYGNYVYISNWRIYEDTDNLVIEKYSGGTWINCGEFFI